ncbi:unnamed protein product [Scytosiphon promiscuus]
MEEAPLERRNGCKRARRATAVSMAMRAVLVVLLAAPHVPACEALKLASIEERGHLGVGLLRAVEVVRGRYERAWALVSAAEPTAEDLDTALELLQANAEQWESLEPAVKLWTERENEATRHSSSGRDGGSSKAAESKQTKSNKHASEHHHRSSTGAAEPADSKEDRAPGAPGASDTTSRIYEEAASLLAHNRAVLGQALARSGRADRGIAELEVACPEILEYQQNAQGRRDSKSWLHCYANLADMYKTERRFEEASSLLARMPWLPSPQGTTTAGDESAPPSPSGASPAAGDGDDGSSSNSKILAVPLGTAQAVPGSSESTENGSGAEETATGESESLTSSPSDQNQGDETAGDLVGELAVTTATRPSSSQDWLNSRVMAAEEVLAAVRSGLLSVAASPEQTTGGGGESATATVSDVPTMVVGAPGHADILREASHYLSAIKGVAAQGWAYVDNELHRMERHPAQAVKPGFQSRREVIHTFRYLLMKARQYASENQSQSSRTMASGAASSQAGSGSGSRWRRKDRQAASSLCLLFSTGGRKASTSSKAPRKGSAARGKSSPRSDGDSSSSDNDGVLTLFIGAGIALLVAAVSSGGGKGQGRRREAERQRTATRAAKTVGSYVEPPQRTAVAALAFHLWGNLKRSGLAVSSHAITTANLSRTLLFTAWASFFERIRAARDSSARSSRAIGGGKATTSSFKKTAGGAQGTSNHKQRSKKNVKKPAAAPARLLVRGDTAMVTPPASPPAAAAGAKPKFAAVAAADVVVVSAPAETLGAGATGPTENKKEKAMALSEKFVKTAAKAAGPPGDGPASGRAAAAAADPVTLVATAAVQAAAEKSAGVPFPDVMTAEQVQAMVEEDERAWEQARLSEKLHSRAATAAASAAAAAAAPVASPSSAAAAAPTAVEAEVEDAAGAGWSEVGGASSRGRAGAGGARGRVLSIRNVRAAAQAARTSSPGSDPATTTSASSSDSSEGCKEKSSHAQALATRGGSRVSARAVKGTARGSTIPRAGTKPAWGGAPPQARGGALRVEQARRSTAARDPDQANARSARAPHPSRIAPRVNAAPHTAPASGKERSVAGVAQKVSAGRGVDRGPVPKPPSAPAAPAIRAQIADGSLRQQPPSAVSTSEGAENEAGARTVEIETPQESSVQPAAWTNTPSHPLGMQPEPAPLPPASEPPCPPPQHQQHWQRQQQREQHQQRQHQQHHHQQQPQHHHQHQQQHQHQHFFHQQEPPLMAMSAAPVPHPHDASHHYPPLSSLPPQAHHHGQAPPQQQQQHEAMMPQQYIPPSEEAFPPPSTLMPVPSAANAAASSTPAMAFPMHPAHVAALPPSPGGGLVAQVHPHFHARDGSFDSPGSGGVGFSPDAAVLAPSQAMVLPPPYEQQQPGRFSPPTLQVAPVEEAGVGSGGVMSPMYGQQGPGPTSGGGFLPNGAVGGGSDGGEAFEALMNALRWQVEYYFSADNLVTDSYLRGLMDPEGFVAVSKIIVFNRVRSMTGDPTLLVAAMRRSSELEILEQDHSGETRVRTKHSPLHWTREQLPPAPQEEQHPHQEHYEQEEDQVVAVAEEGEEEEEEEEEEEHHITFGNVAEVIGRDDSLPISVPVERDQAGSRD